MDPKASVLPTTEDAAVSSPPGGGEDHGFENHINLSVLHAFQGEEVVGFNHENVVSGFQPSLSSTGWLALHWITDTFCSMNPSTE